MKRLAIEINDAGLIVADSKGVLKSEPGFATVDGKRILTGSESFALARLEPRNTSFSHWRKLSIEPRTAHVPGKWSTAELAHAQLERLWREVGADVERVVFVVPSGFGGDAPGILLGLAEDCGIPVGAIIDVAVAASTRPWPERQLVYVDADLHSVFVTPLEQGERIVAQEPLVLGSAGLVAITDAFARRIAERLVQATRFDPFHRAKTEQRLYDALAAALAALDQDGNTMITVADRDEEFTVELERSDLLGAVQGLYRAVRQLVAQARVAQPELVVQLSDRLAGLPGLEEELARLDGAHFVPLPAGHAAISALRAADELALDEPGVKLFRHMSWRDEPAEVQPALPPRPEPVPDSEPGPTHIVYQGIAHPINGAGVVIGRSRIDERRAILIESRVDGVSRAHCEISISDGEPTLRDLSSFGTFVNERRIEGSQVLKTADVIRVGSPGAELTVVRVENDDGT